jgi:hypothetical protein
MTEADLERAALRLQEFPTLVRRMIADLPDEKLRWKKSASDFSIVENVCHLRDIELEGYSVRLRRILEEQQPRLPDIDGGRLARERDYNSQPILGALADFSRERMANVAVICGLRPEQLDRTGHLETIGVISVGRLLAIMQEHDREHLQLIEEARDAQASRAT